jgi:hypothetical protein
MTRLQLVLLSPNGQLKFIRRDPSDLRYDFFRCLCGVEKSIKRMSVKHGKTQSCGCLLSSLISAKQTTHGCGGAGGKSTPEYVAWYAMHRRCRAVGRTDYKHYGGKGVTVCQRWTAFENFLSDMGVKPSAEHSLDRIDSGGNYEPGNCRWATKLEQVNNTSRNTFIEYNGEAMTMANWARRVGISYYALRSRIRLGWTPERALTEKSRGRGKK